MGRHPGRPWDEAVCAAPADATTTHPTSARTPPGGARRGGAGRGEVDEADGGGHPSASWSGSSEAATEGAWMARTVSTVSASAAVLSGRWRLTRAKRSAIPPG